MPDELWRVLTLQDTNTRIAVLGTGLLGLGAGLIGSLAVLRRRALMGDALAHAALPGLWIAFLIAPGRSLLVLLTGAAVAGALGVLAVTFLRTHTRVKEDAAIGIVLSVFFAAGLCLARIGQTSGRGNTSGLDHFIFGKAATMLWQDVQAIAGATAIVGAGVFLFFKEFRLLCFDREFAAAQGWPVAPLDILLMALLVLCTVTGLPAVGVVLMAAMLIIPGAASRFWTERLSTMLLLAGAFGALSGMIGSAVSALPLTIGGHAFEPATGPAIVLTAGIVFVISLLAAPRRGLLSDVLRRRSLSRKIGLQNLLRTLYELTESSDEPDRSQALARIAGGRLWRSGEARRLVRRGRRLGLLSQSPEGYSLTERGMTEARRVVRAHRLWELFLVEQAAFAPEHVDREADQIEHVLPAELLARLEDRLREQGRLPPGEVVPPSPHRIEGAA